MPSVTQTAAFCGLRPVANAFGCMVGTDVEPGHGLVRPACDSSRTIW